MEGPIELTAFDQQDAPISFTKALRGYLLLLRVGEWPEAQALESREPLLNDTSLKNYST